MSHDSYGKTLTKDIKTSQKGQGIAGTSLLPITKCSYKQKLLSSCAISMIPNFLEGFVQKNSMTKTELFIVTSLTFGPILSVTSLII